MFEFHRLELPGKQSRVKVKYKVKYCYSDKENQSTGRREQRIGLKLKNITLIYSFGLSHNLSSQLNTISLVYEAESITS